MIMLTSEALLLKKDVKDQGCRDCSLLYFFPDHHVTIRPIRQAGSTSWKGMEMLNVPLMFQETVYSSIRFPILLEAYKS